MEQRGLYLDCNEATRAYYQYMDSIMDKHGATVKQCIVFPKSEDNMSVADCQNVRFILMDAARERTLDFTEKMLLGDQAGSRFLMFDTQFSSLVVNLINTKLSRIRKVSPGYFNELLGYTFNIDQYPHWINDHVDSNRINAAMNLLFKTWIHVLSHSNEELDIDGEFTRPGVIALLQHLYNAVNANIYCRDANVQLMPLQF